METLIISNDKKQLNISLIHDFLTRETNWAKGIDLATVECAINNSLCFGAFVSNEQVGFCRVITDYATFANLVDVIVWPQYRELGIAKRMMKEVVEHPQLLGVRRFTLATSNAHTLYKQFGFEPLENPQVFMERHNKNIYKNS